VSDEEAMLITGKLNIEDAANCFFEKTNAVFAITLGEDGTLLGWNKKQCILPSIPIEVIDTTGAGDAFVGAVLYQLAQYTTTESKQLKEEDWKAIFLKANKAGARTCQYMGAMEAFRHLHKDLLNT
jgi:fructokinase